MLTNHIRDALSGLTSSMLDTAFAAFKETPHAGEWAALERAMLVHQQGYCLSGAQVEALVNNGATLAGLPEAIVYAATGKSIDQVMAS